MMVLINTWFGNYFCYLSETVYVSWNWNISLCSFWLWYLLNSSCCIFSHKEIRAWFNNLGLYFYRLIGLKNIFARQLPNMPREYIVRLLMDRHAPGSEPSLWSLYAIIQLGFFMYLKDQLVQLLIIFNGLSIKFACYFSNSYLIFSCGFIAETTSLWWLLDGIRWLVVLHIALTSGTICHVSCYTSPL